jgi:hypothetical protein
VRKHKNKYASFDYFLVAADEAKVAGQACQKKEKSVSFVPLARDKPGRTHMSGNKSNRRQVS